MLDFLNNWMEASSTILNHDVYSIDHEAKQKGGQALSSVDNPVPPAY